MTAVQVAASLWSVPATDRPATADRLAAAGLRRWHWDVSDGVLAAPGGFGPAEAAALMRRTDLPGEAHLMVTEPLTVLHAWAAVCDRVIVHAEAAEWPEAVRQIAAAGSRPGVALSPGTSTAVLAALPDDVAVLVMSIVPGQAGTPFSPATPGRLDALRRPGRDLGVDGGVDRARARECGRHGATWVVSGSALCGDPDAAGWLAEVERAEG
ncbi:MAG TPA: hypothetical protein VGC57_00410 [Cellulomonas sp.]